MLTGRYPYQLSVHLKLHPLSTDASKTLTHRSTFASVRPGPQPILMASYLQCERHRYGLKPNLSHVTLFSRPLSLPMPFSRRQRGQPSLRQHQPGSDKFKAPGASFYAIRKALPPIASPTIAHALLPEIQTNKFMIDRVANPGASSNESADGI